MQAISDSERKARGKMAEDAVCCLLVKAGYKIRERNLRISKLGELDIIAWRGSTLTIVEVKARQYDDSYGGPFAAIQPNKRRKIERTIQAYRQKNQLMNNDIIILAAGVDLDRTGKILSVNFAPVEWL